MTSRRELIGGIGGVISLAAGLGARSSRAAVADVKHVHVHGNKATYCGHPRQGGIFHFGNGEIALLHNHAPCTYEKPQDVYHDYHGYHSRAVLLLQRSLDGGQSWPGDQEVEVWNEAAPLEQRERFLLSGFVSPRQEIDLAKPGSMVVFPRTFIGPPRYGASQMIAFGLRSGDKGKTWERVPSPILPPPGCFSATPDNAPIVRMPDGTLLFPNRCHGQGGTRVSLYASTDSGLSWNFRTHICEPRDYPALVLLPGGRLQCYNHPLGMCYSDDAGKTWSKRKVIVPPDPSPWEKDDPFYRDQWAHRSPAPLVLRDGRILLLFARRIGTRRGMGVTVSEDQGATWSPDLILRDDASATNQTKSAGVTVDYSDIGYPLAVQLDDGRIFTTYYFVREDGNKFGGARFIGGTFFRLT